MTMQKNKLLSLLTLLLIPATLFGQNGIMVEKKSLVESQQESYIVKFKNKELAHFTAKDLVPSDQWDALDAFEKDNKGFNRMLLGQAAVVGAAGFICAQDYIDDKDTAFNPKNYALYNKLMSHASKLPLAARWAMSLLAIAGNAGYTCWKYRKMLGLAGVLSKFQAETVDKSVVIYRRMIYSYTIYTGNGPIDIYIPGDPVGWMTIEEHKTQIEPLYQAEKNILKWLLAGMAYSAAATYMGALSLGGHSG